MDFKEIPLFDGITVGECEKMMKCFDVRIKKFTDGETVCRYDGTSRAVGIVLKGRAEMIRIDQNGNRTVLEFLTEKGIFGETLAFTALYDSVTVDAVTNTEILFIDYDDITKRCENACLHHSRLVENMFRLIAEKSRALSERVEVLSGRSIRDKLLSYFRMTADKAHKNPFCLPFSMTTLADYISADRSATARELKRMREDNLVEVDKRNIKLIG